MNDTDAHSSTYSKLIATVLRHAAVVVDDGDLWQLVTFSHLVVVVVVRGRDLHRALDTDTTQRDTSLMSITSTTATTKAWLSQHYMHMHMYYIYTYIYIYMYIYNFIYMFIYIYMYSNMKTFNISEKLQCPHVHNYED